MKTRTCASTGYHPSSHAPPLASIVIIWVIFSTAVVIGAKQFSLWSQVTALQGSSLLELYEQLHPHFSRYLLVYPIFEAAAAIGHAPDTIFSYICLVALFLVFLAVRQVDRRVSRDVARWAGVWWSLSLCGIAMLMNGRGILAFLGYATLLFSLVPLPDDRRPRWWLFISLPVAMLFCSVSSGVLFVAFALMFAACLVCILRHREMRASGNLYLALGASAVTTALFWNFVVIGVLKNLAYYGGGIDAIWTMLNHGAGQIIAIVDPLIVVPFALVLFIASLLSVWAARAFPAAVVICGASVLTALAGGIFGYTTLSVGFVPVLVMIRLLFVRPSHIVLQSPRSYGPSTTTYPQPAPEMLR